MKLAILGGGGFRTPLVYRALLADRHDRRITDVWLHDVDARRLDTIVSVLARMADGVTDPPRVETTTDLDAALTGADFVFSAVRPGGLAGRVADERVALAHGVLGQETTGAGGISFGLRTVPVALDIARRVADVAPDAWVINFTNPAGMVTEAMSTVLGDRVVGICDSPISMARRMMRLLGIEESRATLDYVGLNHLGWLRGIHVDGVDHLPRLLADDAAISRTEEGHLFGPELLRALGAVPNEYLFYYYFAREALASISGSDRTRGEYLLVQQTDFYERLSRGGLDPFAEWERVRLARNETYMAEARTDGSERDEEDTQGGGYEGVALALMGAIARDEPAELILDVRNRGAVPGLPDDAVVEVPCHVDRTGAHPHPRAPLAGHQLGLLQQVKAVERLVIEAARTGDPTRAELAFALHPLVDSYAVARELLADYRAAIPEVDALFP